MTRPLVSAVAKAMFVTRGVGQGGFVTEAEALDEERKTGKRPCGHVEIDRLWKGCPGLIGLEMLIWYGDYRFE
jgi:hypothetical protein